MTDQFGDTLTREPLPLQVANRIMQSIARGDLRPGQKLPNERQLATSLGVARPTVREAIRALQMMRVLDVRQGDATQVAELSAESLIEPFEFLCKVGGVSLEALFEVRLTLEVGIARAAAERISDDELRALQASVLRAEQCVSEPAAFLEADIELHAHILAAARNPLFSSLMGAISRLGRASREQTTRLESLRANTLLEHRSIVDALDARDPDAAGEAMYRHIASVAAQYRAAREVGAEGRDGETGGGK